MDSSEIDAHWNFGDPAGSEARFRSLASTLDGDVRAEVLTQLVRSLGLQERFEEAHEVLDGLRDAGPTARMRATLERGRLRNSSGDKEAAKPLFQDALRQAESIHADYYAVDAAHMLGILEGEGWNRKAIAMAVASSDRRTQSWQGSLYNNLGWSLHDEGRFKEALEAFQTALAFRREFDQTARIPSAEWCIARCLRSLGRVDEALAILERLLTVVPDDTHVQEEIAACQEALEGQMGQ